MSLIDQIKELDAQKARIIEEAKTEALQKAQDAIDLLNSLGFNYRIVEGAAPSAPAQASTGGRRTGIRQEVLTLLDQHPDGLTRSQVLDQLDAKGDKQAEQSISNALSNAKKKGDITLTDGVYRLA